MIKPTRRKPTTKTTKNDKNTNAQNKAAETRAIAEKRKAVNDSALYCSIKSAVDKAIEKAASEGASGTALLEVKIPGELGSPDTPIIEAIAKCEDPAFVTETLAADLESEGYKVLRLIGMPVAVAWPKPDAE